MLKSRASIAFVAIVISVCTLVMTTSKRATAADDPYKDMAGEWSGVWSAGSFYDRAAIVIHEILAKEAKARITLVLDRLDTGREEQEIMADFTPDPVPTITFNSGTNRFTCLFRQRAKKLDVSFDGYSRGVKVSNSSCRMEKRPQYNSNIDTLLEENPLPDGKKSQAIKISENDNATIYLIRATEGAGLDPHFHAAHDEAMYVIRGAGQLLVDGKWVDIQEGSIHFNPVGKTHANRQVGTDPLIFVSVFTPGMKDPDRHFVQQ